jgi:hypothetical protein
MQGNELYATGEIAPIAVAQIRIDKRVLSGINGHKNIFIKNLAM